MNTKLIGIILYVVGFLGVGYVITETRLDFTESFGTLVLLLLWCVLTFGLGTALVNRGDNSNDNK